MSNPAMKISSESDAKLKILTAFLKAFPASKLDKEGLFIYVVMLRDVSSTELQLAMEKSVRSMKFYPSISEIVELVESLRAAIDPSLHIPSVDEAWGEVVHEIQCAFPYKSPVFSTSAIADTVKRMGWTMICMTEEGNMNITRAQFRDIYTSILRREKAKRENDRLLAALPKDAREKLSSAIHLLAAQSHSMTSGRKE